MLVDFVMKSLDASTCGNVKERCLGSASLAVAAVVDAKGLFAVSVALRKVLDVSAREPKDRREEMGRRNWCLK